MAVVAAPERVGVFISPMAKSPKAVSPLADVLKAFAVPAVVVDHEDEAYLLMIKLEVVAPASISLLTKVNVGLYEVKPGIVLSLVNDQYLFTFFDVFM